MIGELHPYYFLSSLVKKPGIVLNFSRYVYRPDSLFDDRVVYAIKGSELSASRVSREIENLNDKEELALHSSLVLNERTFHIPMIDFSTENLKANIVSNRLRAFLPKKILQNMAIFSSGRSYHAYSNVLLTPSEWRDFMGRLLLVNVPNEMNIVDSRWLGHRLIGGYSSLRWSNNSGLYKGLPSKINSFEWF